MDPRLRELSKILARSGDDGSDLSRESNHYFLFDRIHHSADLERAWQLFPAGDAVRRHLQLVESLAESSGYRVPAMAPLSDEALMDLVRAHIRSMRPILLEEDYNAQEIEFIDRGFEVELASGEDVAPPAAQNPLFGTLYEAIGEYRIDHAPFDDVMFEILDNWAVYLTKCDEVAVYLLSPCFDPSQPLKGEAFEPGVRLWGAGCRDAYWAPSLSTSSRRVLVRPPWSRRSP